jgi:hypothetical protein
MASTHARCLCGDIRLTAALPSKWVAHCHCTLCQRSNGAAFVTWVGLEEAVCRIDDPRACLQWYRSSSRGERGFCSRCGASLFFRSLRWPGELHVTLTSFETPVDRAPQAHVFWDTHVDWLVLRDELPRKTSVDID